MLHSFKQKKELNQELLPPRTSVTDIRMFAKCSFQAASWEGSPTKLTRNLLQRTSTKNFCHQERATDMNMSAKLSNQDAAREGSPTTFTRNVLQRTSTKNFCHQGPWARGSLANASPSYLILWTHSSVNSCVFDKLINYFCVCVHVHLCAQTCFGISLESIYTTYIRECIHTTYISILTFH